MKIIERKIEGKRKHMDDCEDGIFINDHFVVLVDGATSKSGGAWQGKSSGELAKDIVLSCFKKIEPMIEKELLMKHLNNKLREKMNSLGVDVDDKVNWLRSSVIVFSMEKSEIWSYGDCQCMKNGQILSSPKLIDQVLSDIRSFVNEIYDCDTKIRDVGREYIKPLLIKQLDYENVKHKYGYPVLNGFSEELLDIKTVTAKRGDEIVFASDGYPVLKESLAESEQELKRLILADPSFTSFSKQTKGVYNNYNSYDDRSYIRFVI